MDVHKLNFFINFDTFLVFELMDFGAILCSKLNCFKKSNIKSNINQTNKLVNGIGNFLIGSSFFIG